MTRSSKELHYWDSCTFLAYLKPEPDKIDNCLSVVKAAQNGQVQIVTSTLTFIEVIKLDKKNSKIAQRS